MSSKILAVIVVLAALGLAACNRGAPTPTLSPPPSPTPTPTRAPTPLPTYTPPPSPTPSPVPTAKPTATPPLGWNTPPFIPPPGSVKLEVVIHPVDTKGRGELKGLGFYFFAPTVGVAPRSLDPRPNTLEPPSQGIFFREPGLPLISTTVLYFARDTLVTLVVQDNRCWFFANWDTTTPFEVIPRLPTIMDLYKTRIQLRLDRDVKIVAYFGKTADYDRTDLEPRCDGN